MSDDAKAVGRPLDRVDGRLKVTGRPATPPSSQVPGRRLRRAGHQHDRQGPDHRPSTRPRPRRRPASSPSSPTATRRGTAPERKEVPGTPNPRSASRSSRSRTTASTTTASRSPSWSPTPSSARPRPPPSSARPTRREPGRHRLRRRGAAVRAARGRGERPHREQAAEVRRTTSAATRTRRWHDAAVRVEQTYTHPAEHHNPMEPHATVAAWDGPKLTLYDKTQWVDDVAAAGRRGARHPQGERPRHRRPSSAARSAPACGPGPTSSSRRWRPRHVRRPVKLVLTRPQMFTIPGYRPHTVQTVALGAATRRQADRHPPRGGTGQTSTYEEYTETHAQPDPRSSTPAPTSPRTTAWPR